MTAEEYAKFIKGNLEQQSAEQASSEYKTRATQEYDPAYNQKIQLIKDNLAANTQALENSKSGIYASYQQQEDDQNLSNNYTKNNLSNNALGRGLGRSSIVTSNLGEADLANNKILSRIRQARTGALNSVDSQIAGLNQTANNQIKQMGIDRESDLATLIRKYQDNDNQMKLEQSKLDYNMAQDAQKQANWQTEMDYKKDIDAKKLALDEKQLAASIAKARASSSGKSSTESKTQMKNGVWAVFEERLDSAMGEEFLKQNKTNIISNLGADEYYKMVKKLDERRQGTAYTQQRVQQKKEEDTLLM